MTGVKPILSIVTPAYNEGDNLSLLYRQLSSVLDSLNLSWEWVVVDDHSSDDTFTVITGLARQDAHIRGIRFARNFGSHTAINCGLRYAKGDCAIVMAADLQDPPQTIPALLESWRGGAQVVWAVRKSREGEKASKKGFSRLYYFLMRNIAGIKGIPSSGADFFLIDRAVIKALIVFRERNVSILVLIAWMGFRQAFIYYDKQARASGKSGWTLEKKFKLAVDSITSFSYLPIRLMSYIGVMISFIGFSYAVLVFYNGLKGSPAPGWTTLMIVVLILGGFQLLMLGILGEYIWRALDEARRRPNYLIELSTD